MQMVILIVFANNPENRVFSGYLGLQHFLPWLLNI